MSEEKREFKLYSASNVFINGLTDELTETLSLQMADEIDKTFVEEVVISVLISWMCNGI